MEMILAQPSWRIVSVTTQTLTSTVADFTVRDVIAWRDDGVSHLLPVTVSSGNATISFFAAISPSGQIIDWLDREHASIDKYVACAEQELFASNAEELAEKRAASAAARRTAA
jgi:hypothetical protein